MSSKIVESILTIGAHVVGWISKLKKRGGKAERDSEKRKRDLRDVAGLK